MSELPPSITLPPGWFAEPWSGYLVITARDDRDMKFGSVTIDFEKRMWSIGMVQTIRLSTTADGPTGRGWREKLVTEAIAALRKALR